MQVTKNSATNIRHAPPICGNGSRTRRGQIGLQVPRQLGALFGNALLNAIEPG